MRWGGTRCCGDIYGKIAAVGRQPMRKSFAKKAHSRGRIEERSSWGGVAATWAELRRCGGVEQGVVVIYTAR
jgi:hypothetical protein